MNYYKNTLSPIADAAKFFSEKKNRISYEEKDVQKDKKLESGMRSRAGRKNVRTARMLSMEYL